MPDLNATLVPMEKAPGKPSFLVRKGTLRNFSLAWITGLRKALRTMRRSPNRIAQRFPQGVALGCSFSLGLALAQTVPAAPLSQQLAVSASRIFLFDPSTQNFRVGSSFEQLSDWRTLPSPPGMFHGHHILPGQAGHFYLVDDVQNRLCLYDTAGQWQSCLRFPESFKNRSVDRLQVIARNDGRYVFVDMDAGFAYLFREVRSGESETHWQQQIKVSVPAKLGTCLEQPWFLNICCLSQGQSQCYDSFLNRSPKLETHGFSAKVDSGGKQWVFTLPSREKSSDSLCFTSAVGFYPCP
jgi:hypothetical protein